MLILDNQLPLFPVNPPKVRRSKTPAPHGGAKPVWGRYTALKVQRCDECEELAYQSLPGPMPLIRTARFSRRLNGVTRLLCHAHARAQHEDDAVTYKNHGETAARAKTLGLK